MIESIPDDWREAIAGRLGPSELTKLDRFVEDHRKAGETVYPPAGLEFEALRMTPFGRVRAVILGQDPYHGPGQAHGLAFSVLAKKWPPSLRNLLNEWHDDCGYELPASGSLEAWAKHGVLLLNTALTVMDGSANSHAHDWLPFSRAIVAAVAARPERIAFLLWGASAIQNGHRLDLSRHVVIESSHPSPFSANRRCGNARQFIGSRPFTAANACLVEPINWSLVA
jgi:uracil-DNA glycosylase